jgi:hypothetical protein
VIRLNGSHQSVEDAVTQTVSPLFLALGVEFYQSKWYVSIENGFLQSIGIGKVSGCKMVWC